MNDMLKRMLIILLILSTACESPYKRKLNFSVKNLQPDHVVIQDYGRALFELDTVRFQASLSDIQDEFIYFLDVDLNDSSKIMQLYSFVTDSFLIDLYRQSRQLYPSYLPIEKTLTEGFRRLHHYFPDISIPLVYSYISGVHAEAPVITDGHALVIGIDCYLGAETPVYQQLGIPRYVTGRMQPDFIAPQVFGTIYEYYFAHDAASGNLLDEMIKAGKRLFFLEAMLPTQPDHLLIGYTKAQYDWLKANEAAIWASVVEEQLLYAGDPLLFRKFFGDGPFTQDFSQEAPARIGEWIGWQIVRKFMEKHTDICVVKLIGIQDSQDILARSHYRPK